MLESADINNHNGTTPTPPAVFTFNSGLTYWKFIIHPRVL